MPILDNSVMQLQIRYRLHGQRCINNIHFTNTDPYAGPVSEETEQFVQAFASTYADVIPLCLSEEVTDITFRAQLLEPNGSPSPTRYMFAELLSTSPDGQIGNSSLPSTSTVVVRKRTALAGRKFRGRIYVPGVPVTFEQDSLITSAAQTLYQTVWETILTTSVDTTGLAWFPCVCNPPTFSRRTIITATAVDRVLRVQRRREVGVGE